MSRDSNKTYMIRGKIIWILQEIKKGNLLKAKI